MAISVVLADDHRGVRESLRCLLEKEAGIEVVGEAENGVQAVQLVGLLHPDVVVMDVLMPELNGIEAARRIKECGTDTKILALSMHAERRYIANMLHAGASGYVLKDHAYAELARAVRSVAGYVKPKREVMCGTPMLAALESLQPGDHVCCIHESEEELHDLVPAFFKPALESGEKALYVADIRSPRTIMEWMSLAGIPAEEALADGRFAIMTPEQGMVCGGVFDPDRAISLITREIEAARAAGFTALRVASEMSWIFSACSGAGRLDEYEAKLNRVTANTSCTIMCLYDRNRFRAEILLDTLKSHPIVITGTDVCDNFYHVPSSQSAALPAAEEQLEQKLESLVRHRQTESSLKKTADLLTYLFDTFPMPVYYKDSRGTYLECNRPFAEQILGMPKEKILGRSLDELKCPFPKRLVAFYREQDAKLLAGNDKQVYETRIPCADGSDRPFHVHKQVFVDPQSGEPAIMGLLTDLSDQKRAEAQSALLFAAIEHAAEAVMITDANAVIQYVNPAFEEITGYSPGEAVGMTPRILSSGRQNETFYHNMHESLQRGCAWSGRLVNRRKNGTLYDEEMTISPVPDAQGNIAHYVAIKRDITEKMTLAARLRQAQKMEAIGTLAGGIAHDFNNILAGILGYSELGLDEVETESRVHEDFQRIYNAGRRAKELVQQILAFTHQNEEARHPIRMESIIKECMKLLRPSIPSNIDFLMALEPDCPRVLADGTQMHQIIMNLCTNAYHAMREKGGTLTVGLHAFHVDEIFAQCNPELRPGPHIRLSVSDTGQGMPAEILDRVFEPYFTTKTVGEGTGLGLATVHGIVTNHGGAVTVSSEMGVGSTFNVYLPAATGLAEERVMEDEPVHGGKERILVVDDEEQLVFLFEKALSRLGYSVTAMNSSVAALEAFKAAPGDFDLILTDQTMPTMTGFQMAGQMLAIRPDLPIILATGYSESIDKDTALRRGISGFITKPAETNAVARLIRRVLDRTQDVPDTPEGAVT